MVIRLFRHTAQDSDRLLVAVAGLDCHQGAARDAVRLRLVTFEQDGLAGLVPHKRGPKQAHKLTDEVLSFIGEVRQKEPSVRLPDLVKLKDSKDEVLKAMAGEAVDIISGKKKK